MQVGISLFEREQHKKFPTYNNNLSSIAIKRWAALISVGAVKAGTP
jgi:hypothetical protein